MQALLGHVVDFVAAHASWAPYLAFLFAFAETLAFLSILVPSTMIFIAVGGLIATGSLHLLPIWIGASLGALAGSTFSWWLGARYGSHLLALWPLNREPRAVERSTCAFARWGGGAIFAGHFFGPIRSVVFVAAGMSMMPSLRFQLANFPGALLWAYVIPKSGELGGGVLGHLWHAVTGS
ncbi:MAG: DedA family protein [Rhodobacteraceae bacterium]|uniref:DedA family protein n=1 Tax=Amaricoccus sp. B4 TaxID=3368557 RepID=UPI000DAC8581|nr:DedA family protein [Paracoccaceae bacterium]